MTAMLDCLAYQAGITAGERGNPMSATDAARPGFGEGYEEGVACRRLRRHGVIPPGSPGAAHQLALEMGLLGTGPNGGVR